MARFMKSSKIRMPFKIQIKFDIDRRFLVFLLIIFSVSLTLDCEQFKIMSFNIQYGNTKSSLNTAEWHNNFSAIVSEVNPDILLIQEAGSSNDGIAAIHKTAGSLTYGMFSTEKYFAYRSYRNSGIQYNGTMHTTQHNIILFKNRKFKAEDLSTKLKFDNPEHTQFPSDFNNFQCVKLTSPKGRILIIVNAHVRPDGKDFWKMKEGTIHSRDTITLRKLLYELERMYPMAAIIAGGDFNYSWKVLTDPWIDGQELSKEWTVDPGFFPAPDSPAGLPTTFGNGPWDHFICNDLVSPKRDFTIPLRMKNNGKESFTYVNGRFIPDKEFNKNISDHWPVAMSFEY